MKFNALEDLKQLEGGYIKVGSGKVVQGGWQCTVLHPAEPEIETVVLWRGQGVLKTGSVTINGLRAIGIEDSLIILSHEQPRSAETPTP